LVLAYRKRQYCQREKASLFWRHRKDHKRDDLGGCGSEIVREVLVCPTCARQHVTSAGLTPDDKVRQGVAKSIPSRSA
jgi:hypothetical protein